MSSILKDMNLLDAHIGVLNYRNLRHVDWATLFLVAVLIALGLFTLYHASDTVPYWRNQAIRFAIGVALMVLLVCVDYRFLVSLSPMMYVGALLLLGAVPLFGVTAKGGQHWLPVGPFRLQPSELSKVALVYMLVWYLSAIQTKVKRFHYFLLTFVVAGGVCGMVLLQGDLGTTITLLPIPFVMLYVAGARWWHLLLVVLTGLAASPLAWDHLKPYQRARLVSFIDPAADPRKSGYQLRQAKIAIGSGQMTGKGFGENTQASLNFVPEDETDFVFVLLAEGKGFLWGALVIVLFAALLVRGSVLARDGTDMAATLLIAGATTVIGFHAFVNIAIPLGLMPVTGIPLPFFSYGGSFCLATMMCVGTILSANVKRGIFE